MTTEQLNDLIKETLDLGKRIVTVDKMISSLRVSDPIKSQYKQSLDDLLSMYKQLSYLLENELELYIDREKKESNKITLEYRKILKGLKQQ